METDEKKEEPKEEVDVSSPEGIMRMWLWALSVWFTLFSRSSKKL